MDKKIPIAVQTWPVREDFLQDMPGTLKAIAGMGYDGVELCYYWPEVWDNGEGIRKMCDDVGLQVLGAHVGWEHMSGDSLKRVIEFSHVVGMKYPIVPGLSEEIRTSRAALLNVSEMLGELAETLKPEGLYTGYHNHRWEFAPLEGESPFDTIFGNIGSDVIMQLDIGHAFRAGVDPTLYLNRYPGRAKTVHLRGYSPTNENALIGEGTVAWEEIFAACEGPGGAEWYIVEQEVGLYSPLECAERCLRNLREMGK